MNFDNERQKYVKILGLCRNSFNIVFPMNYIDYCVFYVTLYRKNIIEQRKGREMPRPFLIFDLALTLRYHTPLDLLLEGCPLDRS